MSHTDYNGISTKNAKDETVVDNLNEVEDDTVIDASIEDDETTTAPDKIEEPEYVFGTVTVTGCAKLNVRKQPSVNADVLFVIGKDSDVLVDMDESIGDWYKVYIDEKEGFCMKKFIELDQ